MKASFKKLWSVLLVCLLVCSCVMLAACGKTQITITLDQETATLEEYRTLTLTAEGADAIEWTSSDETVATVANGVVSALKAGETTITASATGAKSASCVVTVTATTVEAVVTASNDEITMVQDDDPIEVEVSYTWDGMAISDAVTFAWESDDESIVTVAADAQDSTKATISPAAPGETSVFATATIRGKEVSAEIIVTVIEPTVAPSVTTGEHLVADVQGNGYNVDLTMLATDTTVSSVDVAISATYGKLDISDVMVLSGEMEDEEVASYADDKITALKVGETTLTLTVSYTLPGTETVKTAQVVFNIAVTRAAITLEKTVTIETQNLQTISFAEDGIEGTVSALTIGGKDVFSSYEENVATLASAKLPVKSVDGLGEGLDAELTTDKAVYSFKANIYTKILMNKDDLDGMGAIAKAIAGDNGSTWDGYFVLGADIEYNGVFKGMFFGDCWTSAGNINALNARGFKGTFDGHGHKINGMTIQQNTHLEQSWGFIAIMKAEGVIKNVAFTNATVINSNFLCSYFGGTIENVQIEFVKVVKNGSNETAVAGSGQNLNGAKMVNVIVDYSHAEITGTAMTVGNLGANSPADIALTNVFAIGGGGVMKKNGNGAPVAEFDIVYDNYAALLASANYTAKIDQFDEDAWTVKNGILVMKGVYDETALAITNEPAATVFKGTSLEIAFNKSFVDCTFTKDGEPATLAYKNGAVIVPDSDDAVGHYVLTAKYIFDEEEVAVTHEFDVASVVNTTVKQDVDFNYSTSGVVGIENVVFDLSDAGEDLGTITSLLYGTTDIAENATLSGSTLTISLDAFGKDYGEKTITLVSSKDGTIYNTTINATLITKVIKTKDDLDNLGPIAFKFSTAKNGGENQWDGYFVLGADIAYNGTFAGVMGAMPWRATDPANKGFRGVINGRGHYIDGLAIEKNTVDGNNCGFVAVLMGQGVLENISFTNASVTDAAFISNKMAPGATYKNIYVQYKSIIGDTADTATFSPTSNFAGSGVVGMYIFIDASKVETYTNSTKDFARARLLARDGVFCNPNCYGVLNSLAPQKGVEGVADADALNLESVNYVAQDVATFKAKPKDRYNVSGWDMTYWEVVEDGRILPKTLPAELR